jgi:hypothetical protein
LLEEFLRKSVTAILMKLCTTSYWCFTANEKEPDKPLLSFFYKVLDIHVYQALVQKIPQSDYFVPGNSNIQITFTNIRMPCFYFVIVYENAHALSILSETSII